MALGNILSQIAKPQVANVSGALGQGLQQGSQFAQNQASTNLLRQQSQQGQQRFDEESAQKLMIDLSNGMNMALQMSPGVERTNLLKSLYQKAPPGSEPRFTLQNIISDTNEESVKKKLKGVVDASVQAGLIKPQAKATKTTDMLEREVAAKELQAESGAKTPAIKEFEYAEKNPKFLLEKKEKEMIANARDVAGKSFKNAMDLRKEFTSQSADFQKVRDAFTRVKGSTDNPSPAGDLSLIFNYMKMLDPGSVVRESEFATAASAGSYGERIKAAVQKVASGERLSPKMRADFLSKSKVLMNGIEKQHKKREKSYTDIAKRNKLNPEEVVVDLTVPEETVATPEAQTGYQDGTIIENDAGERMIQKNGEWVPLGGI